MATNNAADNVGDYEIAPSGLPRITVTPNAGPAISPDDHDLLVRTVLPDAAGKSDAEIADAARGIMGRVGKDGETLGDVVLGRGNYPAWETAAPLKHPKDSQEYVRVARAITQGIQSDAQEESAADFEKRLGIGPSPAKGQVIKAAPVETPAEFEKRLGIGPPGAAATLEPQDLSGSMAAANAFSGGFVRGIPIVGPAIDTGAQKAAAYVRSRMYGTPYEDELKAVQGYAKGTAEAHPNLELAGNVVGGINALAPAMVAAPTLMGMSGPLAQRAVMGGASGAGINALDQAVRSGGDMSAIRAGAEIGGAFGAGAPLAARAIGAGGNALRSIVMRSASNPETNALVTRAGELGIPIRPPQLSTSPFWRKVDQMVGQLPGAITPKLNAEQDAAITRAVSRTFGADTSRLTPDVMLNVKRRFNNGFDNITQRMSAGYDDVLANRLDGIRNEVDRYVTNEGEKKAILNHVEDVEKGFSENGMMEGKAYHNLVKKGVPLDRATKSSDSNVNFYAKQIRGALDDSAMRWSPSEISDQFREIKRQYKNLKTVEPLINKGTPGEISPMRLNEAINRSFKDRAYYGAGDLGDIDRIVREFMPESRDSGTPIGTAILSRLVPAAAGGGLSYWTGNDWLKSAGWGLAGLAGTAAIARGASSLLNNPTAMSKTIQRAPYLAPPIANYLRLNDQRQQQ